MTTGQKIYECRKRAGITQEELAERLGVSRQAVSKWEADASFPETENILGLCELFCVSADELLFGREPAAPGESGKGAPETPCEQKKEYGVICRDGGHFEYRSKACVFGIPLLHVNVGRGKLHRACAIVSVGNLSVGVLSVGIFSFGVFALGAVALGLLFALGGVTLGIFSAGGLALGAWSVGGLAVGIFGAAGGLALGQFACGGAAFGRIAVGDFARGALAVGNSAAGTNVFAIPADGAMRPAFMEELETFLNTAGYGRSLVRLILQIVRGL